MSDHQFSEVLRGTRVIAVLRAPEASKYEAVVRTLLDSGVVVIELTLTTPGTLDVVSELCEKFGDSASIGVGTVLTAEDAAAAIDAGARFIVAPNFDPEVVRTAQERGVSVLPGVMTPTEVHAAREAGAEAVKVFPAQTLGAGYLKHLRGPYPDLQVVPSGGVDLEQAKQWLSAGAPAVSVGGPLLGDVFTTGDLGALKSKATEFVADLEDRHK